MKYNSVVTAEKIGILKMILFGAVMGIINTAFFWGFFNDHTQGTKVDEVAINTYSLNLFVGWVLFTVWFLGKADEETKKTAEAVAKKDKFAFLIEAPKRIALSIRVLYVIFSILVVLSFHLFHIQSQLVLMEVQFGVGFMVALTGFILWDLDDPIGGVIHVGNIPEEWIEELNRNR